MTPLSITHSLLVGCYYLSFGWANALATTAPRQVIVRHMMQTLIILNALNEQRVFHCELDAYKIKNPINIYLRVIRIINEELNWMCNKYDVYMITLYTLSFMNI